MQSEIISSPAKGGWHSVSALHRGRPVADDHDHDDNGGDDDDDDDGLPAYSHQSYSHLVGICHNDERWEYDTVTFPPCKNPSSIYRWSFWGKVIVQLVLKLNCAQTFTCSTNLRRSPFNDDDDDDGDDDDDDDDDY